MNAANIERVIKDIEQEDGKKRKRTSLYIAEDVYRDFRRVCGKASPSKVIEKMMKMATEEQAKTK